MRKVFLFLCLMIAGTVALSLSSCGGDDDDSGGNSGGGVSFNADHTGYVIEEVGYGSDDKNPINWTMTGNVITVTLDGTYVITWTIQQVIDDNTVIISDGKRNYNVVRDGTSGGTSSSNFVSKGGGSLTVAQLLGTWQVYHVECYAIENGQEYSQSYDIYPNDQSKGMTTCYRYEFYADYTYKRTEYYNGDWIAPRNYSYRETGGRIYLPEGGSPAPEYCMVTANKTRSDEIVITTHYTSHDQYTEYLLKRVEGGETPVSFNADHTGYVIEEVGYGSDDKNPINWTMTGNVITVTLDGTYVITWTIQQVIDDNTVIISDGKRTYNVVRDGTGGGGNNEGGGSATGSGTLSTPLTVAQIYDIVSAMPPNIISSTDYYAKGKISRIKYSFSSQYGTAVFNISDNGQASGKQFTIYSAYYKAMRQNWTDGDTQVNVGDEVVVCGKVVNYNANTPEFAERECYVVTINGK